MIKFWLCELHTSLTPAYNGWMTLLEWIDSSNRREKGRKGGYEGGGEAEQEEEIKDRRDRRDKRHNLHTT